MHVYLCLYVYSFLLLITLSCLKKKWKSNFWIHPVFICWVRTYKINLGNSTVLELSITILFYKWDCYMSISSLDKMKLTSSLNSLDHLNRKGCYFFQLHQSKVDNGDGSISILRNVFGHQILWVGNCPSWNCLTWVG